MGLSGRGDILIAATQGGVVFWDLSSGRAHIVTTEVGLPSQVTVAASLDESHDELLVATLNGLGRGWMDGPWLRWNARDDEQGPPYYSAMPRPGGGWIAGGERGRLCAWTGNRTDSLFVPTSGGRVVGLTWAPALVSGGARAGNRDSSPSPKRPECAAAGTESILASASPDPIASIPPFPLGLVVALDNDGVWLLRSVGAWARWTRFGEQEGLPNGRMQAVATDVGGNVWVATTRGVARIRPDGSVDTWPSDPLLSQRVWSLLMAPDGLVYLGLSDGLARLDPIASVISAERLPGVQGPVLALAWTSRGLWLSDGSQVCNLDAVSLQVPASVATTFSMTLYADADTLWAGHLDGRLSRQAGGKWLRFGLQDGLPSADVLSFLRVQGDLNVGTRAGLYIQRRLGPGAEFSKVEGSPAGEVRAQALRASTHFIGGSFGLWKNSGSGWQPFDLWPGASEVQDAWAAAETLWVSAGRGGLAFHDGTRWFVLRGAGNLVGAWFGKIARNDDGRVLAATDHGLALWSGGELRLVDRSSDVFVNAVAWWGDAMAYGTYLGLCVRAENGAWSTQGVLDGLPGVRVLALAPAADGGLRLGTSRGLGWLPQPPESPVTRVRRRTRQEFIPYLQNPANPGGGRFESPGSRLEILDVRGRCIYRAVLGADGPTDQLQPWLGRDRASLVAASGIYFVQISPPGGQPPRTRRLVLVR
jgi:ligand-binding sensor domain-containing protein